MKKLLVTLLFVTVILATTLFAQSEVNLVGGLNLSTVKYNDNTVDDYADISMKSGFILGIETISGAFVIGGSFIQRGANIKIGSEDFEGSDTYNYLSGYVHYNIPIQKQLSVFGGCQLGKFIGGTSKFEWNGSSGSFDLEAENFAIDFGLLFGADVMFNSSIGLRGSYYLGLVDVISIASVSSNENYKNRGIGICLLYKI